MRQMKRETRERKPKLQGGKLYILTKYTLGGGEKM